MQIAPKTSPSVRTYRLSRHRVLGEEGVLYPSRNAYDKRVAGVVSGAGDYKPGSFSTRIADGDRKPIALLGKAYCKVDAQYGATK